MEANEETNWKGVLWGTLKLAGPIVLGNLGQILIGVVDTMMIGRIGITELGASAFVNNIFVVPMVGLMGVLAAITILVSQAKGGRDERAVGRHLRHGLVMAISVSLVAMVLLALNSGLLDRYGQEPEVVAASKGYYGLVVASLLPVLVYQGLKSVWEGLGWSNPPMVALMGGIALNVFLNWILIFGKLGFPELGLVGAGWATLIARSVVALAMLALTLKAKRFASYRPRRWLSGYELAAFRKMFGLGLPMGAQHLFEVGAFAGAGIIVGWISKEALAAHQVALSCASMAFMIPLGISIACGIRVGEAWGAGDRKRVRTVYRSALVFGLLQTSVTASVFLLGGDWLAGLYVDESEVISLAASILVVVGLFQIFDGAQVTCLGALRGMSDVNIPMVLAFVTYWLVAIPAGYYIGFVWGYGAIGVWTGLAVGLFCAAVSLYSRLRHKAYHAD